MLPKFSFIISNYTKPIFNQNNIVYIFIYFPFTKKSLEERLTAFPEPMQLSFMQLHFKLIETFDIIFLRNSIPKRIECH